MTEGPTSPPQTPLALRGIAVFEGVKGALALAAACGIISLRHTDLQAATSAFLLRHGINPDRHYTHMFVESVANATHRHVGQIVAFALTYAAIRLVEGYGLWHGKHWAEWFAVISAGLYLPIEFQHYIRHVTLLNAAVICFNVALVLYMARLLNRQRKSKGAVAPPSS